MFHIIVMDMNEKPMKIELVSNNGQLNFPVNAARVNENSPNGTVVGTVTAYDQDAVQSLAFSLDDDATGAFAVDSSASCSNESFNDSTANTKCSTLLKVTDFLNHEADVSKSIIVRATDNNGLHHSQLFSIAVIDQNDRPTDIKLNGIYNGSVNENENNKLIGTFSTEDEDINERHT